MASSFYIKNPWTVSDAVADRGRFKRWRRSYPRELDACVRNLDHLHGLLQAGRSLSEINVHYLRSEGRGLFRIGQTRVPHGRETRLYIWPDASNRCIYILTVGGKDTQHVDIGRLHKIIVRLKKERIR
jgi:hypothetical protein